MKLRQKIGISVCLSVLSTNIYCGIKEAMESYSAYNYGKSFIEFSVLAKKEDTLSQFMLGIMFLDEKCVLGKSQEAYKYYLEDLNLKKSKEIDGYYNPLMFISKSIYGGCSQKNNEKSNAISFNVSDVQKNDDVEAFSWLLKAANHGDIDAQFLIALMYLNGIGVEASDANAFFWLSKLANDEHILSQYYLALFYQNGWSVDINSQESIKWLSSAAEKNNTDAQFMLGSLYEQGNGVAKDLKKANEWYKKSADNHGDAAKIKLGIHPLQVAAKSEYTESTGVILLSQYIKNSSRPKFPSRTYLEEIVYKKLSDSGDLESTVILAGLVRHNNAEESYNLYKKSAELGSNKAQYKMWQLNLSGIDDVIKPNINLAKEWLFLSANNGNTMAQLTLASLYYGEQPSFSFNLGFSQDYKKSFYWYSKVLVVNESLAIDKIALMYEEGKGVIQDYQQALKLYIKSANQGRLEGYRNLGGLYRKLGLIEKSVASYKSLAKKGDIYSQYMLGLIYKYGDGSIKKDYAISYIWFNLAASRGDNLSINERDEVFQKMNKNQINIAQKNSKIISAEVDKYLSECKSDNLLCQSILFHNRLNP